MHAVSSGKVRAVYVMARTDDVRSEYEPVEHALRSLDLLVAQDIFPAKPRSWRTSSSGGVVLEKDGTFTNTEAASR